jgi:hypothetical protein
MGDIYGKFPATVGEWFAKRGVTSEQYDAMTAEERTKKFTEILAEAPSRTETLITAVDLLLNARFGYPEGTAGLTHLNVRELPQHVGEEGVVPPGL